MKKYLFVLRRAPYQGNFLAESMDMILTAAAFDQRVAILFLEQAIWQLVTEQQPGLLDLKDATASLQALALYDVTELYVEQESLIESGVTCSELSLPTRQVPRNQIGELMCQYDVIISD